MNKIALKVKVNSLLLLQIQIKTKIIKRSNKLVKNIINLFLTIFFKKQYLNVINVIHQHFQ